MFDGVLVFSTVEPSHGDLASRVRQCPARGHHGLREVIKEICLFSVARLFGILRRHFARVQRVEDLLPAFRLLDGGDAERQLLQIHLPFLRLGIVTVEAVCFEECPVFVWKACFGRGLACARRHKATKSVCSHCI